MTQVGIKNENIRKARKFVVFHKSEADQSLSEYLILNRRKTAIAMFSIAISLLSSMSLSGCRRDKKPAEYEIKYEAVRPEWAVEKPLPSPPDSIGNMYVDSVKFEGGCVWFGLRGFGLARLKPETGKWSIYDAGGAYKKLEIHDVEPVGDIVYIGTGGNGLLRLDTISNRWSHAGPDIFEGLKSAIELVRIKNDIYISGHSGFFAYDTASNRLQKLLDGKFSGLTYAEDRIIASYIKEEGLRLCLVNPNKRPLKPECFTKKETELAGFVLAPDGSETLISCYDGYLIYNAKNGSFKQVKQKTGVESFQTSRIMKYRGGRLIVTTSGSLVFEDIEKDKWVFIDVETGLPDFALTSAITDGKNLYFGSDQGIRIIGPERFELMKSMAESKDGADGAANEKSILTGGAKASSPWRRFTVRDGLLSDKIFSLITVSDEVWVGTDFNGLTRISIKDFSLKTFLPEEKAAGAKKTFRAVTKMASDGDEIWHGGYGYFAVFDRRLEKWTDYFILRDMPESANIEAILIDPDSTWIGVRKFGYITIDRNTKKQEPHQGDYMRFSPHMTFLIRARESVWAGMDTGIRKFNAATGAFNHVGVDLFDVQTAQADGDAMWIGCRERTFPPGPNNSGVYRFDTRTRHLVSYNDAGAVCGTHVNDLFVDGPNVWVATKQGIYKHSRLTGRWERFGKDCGLEANNITAVAVNSDMLFLGSNQGVYAMPTIQFSSQKGRDAYSKAWKLYNAGRWPQAAQSFKKALDFADDNKKEDLLYRLARSHEMNGDKETAYNIYESLLKKRPLLLLDMQSIYTDLFGYGNYIDEVRKICEETKEGAYDRKYCNAFLARSEPSLKRYALNLERGGNVEEAVRRWKIVADITADKTWRAEAKENISRLSDVAKKR